MVQFNIHANFISILFLILLAGIQDAYCGYNIANEKTQPLCTKVESVPFDSIEQ